MSFDPYLHFQGNCRDAMTAYHAIFGGTHWMVPAPLRQPGQTAPAGLAHTFTSLRP